MTELINQDLLKRIQTLQLDMGNFFDVLSRAKQQAGGNKELTAHDVRNVLQDDVHLFLTSPKLTPASDDLLREEAQKQVQLNNELRPLLGLIAGISPSLISELTNRPNQQMGSGMGGQENNLRTHPKLAKFLDQAASSFLDAYRKIEEAQNSKDPNQATEALKNANELSLQYKMMMKNSPKLKAEFENRMKMAPAPGYKPTVKPSPF